MNTPQTHDDWEAYIRGLSRKDLWSNVINANSQGFVTLLLNEGQFGLAGVDLIMKFFVRRLASLEMKIPEGGAFDLLELYKEDPVAQAFAQEPLSEG